nr:penicillin-binding protein 2 [Candidatus Solincola tengchongensis]
MAKPTLSRLASRLGASKEDEVSKGKNRDARINLATLLLLAAFGLIAYRLVYLQVFKADRYEALAREQRQQLADLKPRRGCILDRDGEVLAISQEAYSIYAIPYLVKDAGAAAAELSLALGRPRQEIEEKLRSGSGFVYLARKVDPDTAERVEAMGIQGIGLEKESKRFYPRRELACQVLGYVGTDNVGLAGLELQYEEVLAGEEGQAEMEVDPKGDPIPGVTKVIKRPVDGCDIQLSIDSEIQFKLQEQLKLSVEGSGAKGATGLVMDCRTGEILAMASYPHFDVNAYPETDPALARNRAVTDAFEPGSVLKVITAMAALEEQVVSPGSVIHIPPSIQVGKYEFKDDHPMPKSDITFTEVIAHSSNLGTIKTAMSLGKEAMAEYLRRCGLGTLTGVDFPGEVAGKIPDPAAWTATTLPTTAIGQGVTVTPLQLAAVMSMVANGGRSVRPHFLRRIIHPDGSREEYETAEGERAISGNTAASLRHILEEVVRIGTGTRASMALYNCGGKTGTAMKPDPKGGYREAYIASFAGFAPAEDPRLVAVITIDEPVQIYGGLTAAPCFSKVMEFALQHLEITPSQEKRNTSDRVVPE